MSNGRDTANPKNSGSAQNPPSYGALEGDDKHRSSASPRSIRLAVDVIIEDGDWSALKAINSLVDETVAALAIVHAGAAENQSVTLALTSDAHVAALNQRYRQKPGPTNVLSFPNTAANEPGRSPGAPPVPLYLGDIVMAAQTVAGEALDLDIPLQDHFRHLLVHGLLHLHGFDHQTDEDARKMEAIEVAVLDTLGIKDPYFAST